ncbi:MAG TPA: hypothetical protein VMJ30_04430, partial [Gemmatimonadales bacterium]|nr:hypothetical protein [Gemmatimonadales bacterium]
RWNSLLLAALALAACHKKPVSDKPAGSAQDEADLLGRDVFATIDAVLSYRSMHQGKLPATLRQVGVDSLSKYTIRRLAVRDGAPEVTVVFRSTDGMQLSGCRGGADIQEEASLNSGIFTVTCGLRSGEAAQFKIPGTH